MNLSLSVAVVLLGAKAFASVMTGSSAIYADAAESVVHVLAVDFAAWALLLSHKPADNTPHFGHDKISYISAGFEGAMIPAAAALIRFTDWLMWDPIFAVIAALNILRVDLRLIRESLGGLLDEAVPIIEKWARDILDAETAAKGLAYHNFRHRHSGRAHWVEFHLVFPDEMTVGEAHDRAMEIEAAVAAAIAPEGRVITHLEPRYAEQRIEP